MNLQAVELKPCVLTPMDKEPPLASLSILGAMAKFIMHLAGPAPAGNVNWPLHESAGAQGYELVPLPTMLKAALGFEVPQPVP